MFMSVCLGCMWARCTCCSTHCNSTQPLSVKLCVLRVSRNGLTYHNPSKFTVCYVKEWTSTQGPWNTQCLKFLSGCSTLLYVKTAFKPLSQYTSATCPHNQRISQLWKAVKNNVRTDNLTGIKRLDTFWKLCSCYMGKEQLLCGGTGWGGCCYETLFEALHSFVLANPNEHWIIATQTLICCLWIH